MAPYDWNTIRQNIFAGESGGDYDALFGYSNRPGRQFEGTRLTDMTVDQALNFANPSGAYGQWVKGQVGRVATPMGAYQVVGTTLRDAKRGLGLRGDEKMTPDLQDRIGRWIYETQGTGAWEGYKPDAGARSVAADTMQALGKGKTMTPMVPTAAPQQERKGFLGGLLSDPDLLDRLAIGLTGMTMNPNVGLQQVASARIAKRAEERNVNKTVEMLKRMEADPKLIELAQAGYAKEAIGLAYAQPKEKYTTMTGAQLNAQYGTKVDPEKLYNVSPTGQITQVGGGGTSVNLTTGDLSPGWKKIDEKFAENYVDWNTAGAGDAVKQSRQLRSVLDALERGEPLTGPVVGLQPDVLQSFLNPNALNARQQVEEVVQRNLKNVLGAQFTQAEGERLIARAFDQRLSPEQNAARLRALLGQMEAAAANTAAMVDYFNEQGTLRGYKGGTAAASIGAFDAVLDSLDTQQKIDTRERAGDMPPPQPKVGDVMSGSDGKRYRFKGGDAKDPNSWEML